MQRHASPRASEHRTRRSPRALPATSRICPTPQRHIEIRPAARPNKRARPGTVTQRPPWSRLSRPAGPASRIHPGTILLEPHSHWAEGATPRSRLPPVGHPPDRVTTPATRRPDRSGTPLRRRLRRRHARPASSTHRILRLKALPAALRICRTPQRHIEIRPAACPSGRTLPRHKRLCTVTQRPPWSRPGRPDGLASRTRPRMTLRDRRMGRCRCGIRLPRERDRRGRPA